MIMARKKRRTVLILSILVALVLIILVTLLILYNVTDMFKSNDVLFSKYTSQLVDNLYTIYDKAYISEMEEIQKNNKLSFNTTAKVEYTEDGNADNPINNIQMNIQGEEENASSYDYKDISLTQDEENLAEFEYVQDGDISGIRLNGIRQYLSTNINNDNRITAINNIFNTNIEEFITLTSEEFMTLKDKYMQIIMDNITNANYSNQKGIVLEINGIQYNTNSYSLTITKEQFNNIYIKILEEIQKDDIILSKIEAIDNKINQYYYLIQSEETSNLKQDFVDKISESIKEIQSSNIGNNQRTISVFETDGVAISLSIDTEESFMGLDVVNTEGNNFINLLGNEKTEEETANSFDLKVQKVSQINNEELTINYDKMESGKEITNQFIINRKMENNQISNNINISRSVNQNEINISIDKIIDIINNFEEKENLVENENNIIFENLDDEQKENVKNNLEENMNNQIDTVLQVVPLEDIDSMLVNLELAKEKVEDISNEGTVTEVERTRFNFDFELFEGENVTKDRVKELAQFVQGNLKDIRITQYEEQSGNSDERIPLEYRLIIERNTDNSELVERFVNYIDEGRSDNFSVRLEYDETTGLVSDVYVTVVTDR